MKSKITPEQREFIRKNIDKFDSVPHFTKRFNELFEQDIKYSTMASFISKTLKIKRNKNSGKFNSQTKPRSLPIGTIRKSAVGTYIKVCESGVKLSGYQKPDWIPLQEKVYIDNFGPVPDGCFICFLDCNNENFSPDNLYPVSRRISAYLSSNKMWNQNPDLTKTAIILANLITLI